MFKVFQMFTSQKLEQWNMCIPIAIGIKCANVQMILQFGCTLNFSSAHLKFAHLHI
jgi:hypothetical protein